FRENAGVNPEFLSAGSRGTRFTRVFAHSTKARGKRRQPGVQDGVRIYGGFGQATVPRDRAADGDQCGGCANRSGKYWTTESASRSSVCSRTAKLCAA